jgi:NmrA-like family
MTNGELTHVSWFDSKVEVETYIRGLSIMSAFFMAGYYMQNFKDTAGGPKPDLVGPLVLVYLDGAEINERG